MKVIFCRSRKIGSVLIRLFTFSKWSHVALILPDGRVLEAVYPKVRLTTVEEVISTHDAFEIRSLDIEPEMVEWGLRQVGKPYDIWGLFAVLMPYRKWMQDGKWFCSELLAAMTGKFTEAVRVSPQVLYLVSEP